MSNRHLNVTPHFSKKRNTAIRRKSPYQQHRQMSNSPLPRGFLCALAKGVRGMSFSKKDNVS